MPISQYTQTTSIKKTASAKKYFLPAKDQVFGLVFGDDVPIEDQNNLENIFQENSELVFPDCEVAYTADGIEVRTEVETATKGPRVETEKGLQAQEGMNPNDASKGLGNMLTKGGDVLKDGISSGGEYVGKGIKKTKGFLKNQFGKNEAKKEVSETTIQKLRMANKATVKIKEYTIGGIKNLMDFAIGLGKDAAEEIGQMKDADGQKHEDNKYWIHGKNIGTGVQHVAGGIWAGLTEAWDHIIGATGDVTKSVVGHKYGSEMGNAVGIGVDIVTNATDIWKAPSDQMKKVLYDNTNVSEVKDPEVKK